ncbi:hypothetical protein Q5P01_002847 [Channa striata]|uniref:Ig-like domain-containing protein n=1 Tax=Channa striata TaxID=64152 RepID=A0AA88T8H6_CHASR|nr:hypothetical protein Q5P01_002847 [Channa striata]
MACSAFSVFVYRCIFVTVLFKLCRAQPQAASSQVLVALVGSDIVLPCHLDDAMDAPDRVLEWARPDLSPGFIHVWEKNKEIVALKQLSYMGRTSLLIEKLEHRDVSLKLSKVTLSDEGVYRCLIPARGQETFVRLIVGSVSVPVIEVFSGQSEELLLQCESKGWYPEPEVLWLDAEGHVLSAGPTETA